MNKRVIIIGAGGHGKVIADIVRQNGDIIVGFLDDAYDTEVDFYGTKILGKTDLYKSYVRDCQFVIAIGNNSIREKISGNLDVVWYTAIHPSAQISPSATIGEGTVVMPNAVINADAIIGCHCIINTGSVVEHDCEIGDFTHISPRAVVCGVTKIGKSCWVGAGSTITQVINICNNVTVGAGGVVVRDIDHPGAYAGVPTKKIK